MRRVLGVLSTVALVACGDDSTNHLADAASDSASPDSQMQQVNPGIYVTDQNSSIFVFPLDGSGDVAPTRTISGADTGLALSIGIAVDRAGNIYVANRNGGGVTVYAPDANGDAAPIRTLTATGMDSPETIVLDGDGNAFVATCPSCGEGSGGAVGIFHFPAGTSASDSSIQGSDTGLTNPAVTLDPAGELVISNSFGGLVETFPATATGDATPLRSFTPAGDPNIQSLFAGPGVIALSVPGAGVQLYDASATGSASPVTTIAASASFPLQYPGGMHLDASGAQPVLYVVDFMGNAIYVIETTGSGTQLAVGSVRTITGSDTGLDGPLDIVVVH